MNKSELLCAKIKISFDRGTKRNNADDLGLENVPEETKDGGLVRGLGSHWRSKEAKERATKLGAIEARIRKEFERAFTKSNLDGVFLIPEQGAAQEFVKGLENVPNEISVHVVEFSMGFLDRLPPEELVAWTERVRAQIEAVPLGRKKEADADGLDMILKIIDCPIIPEEVRKKIQGQVNMARLGTVERLDLRRNVAELVEVKVTEPVLPRRVRADVKVEIANARARPRRVKIRDEKDEAESQQEEVSPA